MLRGHAIKEYILDILFPKRCVTCGFFDLTPKFDTFLCDECFERIVVSEVSKIKSRDEKFIEKGLVSIEDLFEVRSLYHINEPLLRLIHAWKYDYLSGMEYMNRLILSRCDSKLGEFLSDMVLVPIPLHRRRFAERGFNQSEFIANVLSSRYNVLIRNDILKRSRHTKQQARLTKEKRFLNTNGAFVYVENKIKPPKFVCLIDDVCTTGATMRACADVLLEAGCERVVGCVFARGDS